MFFTYLGSGGHFLLMPTPRAMFHAPSVICLLMCKALFNYYSRLAHVVNVKRYYISATNNLYNCYRCCGYPACMNVCVSS